MARGVPLTPEQLATAAEVYERTGNYSEAARTIGVEPSTVYRAMRRRGGQNRAKLHTRACARATRRARRHLSDAVDRLGARVALSDDDAKLARLAEALAKTTGALLAVGDRGDRNRQAALTREKTRTEIALNRAKLAGTLPADNLNVNVDPGTLFAQLRAFRAERAGAGGGDVAGGTGGAAGGDAVGTGAADPAGDDE
jgi:transposase-like protein